MRRTLFKTQDVEKFLSKKQSNRFSLSIRNLFLEIMSKHWEGHPRLVVISTLCNSKDAGIVAAALSHVAKEFECDARVLKLGEPSGDDSGTQHVELVHTGLQWGRGNGNGAEKNEKSALPTSLVVKNEVTDPDVADAKTDHEFNTLVNGADLVIIETPSIFETRDAKALAAYASDVLLVVEWGKTPPSALKAARDIFRDQTNLAAVITRVNWRAHARRNYGDEIEFSAH
jgi:hypothetical protein